MRSLLDSIVLLALLGSVVGCASLAVADGWERRVLASLGPGIAGCAMADLDPSVPGDELVAVAESGDVWLVARDATGGPRKVRIATVEASLAVCAIGDADLDAPGLEIVVAGASDRAASAGRVFVLRATRDGWVGEPVFEDAATIEAVAIEPGEVFCAGRGATAYRLVHGPSGWRSDKVAALPGGAKAALVVRGTPVIACADGSLVRLERDGAGWSSAVVHQRHAVRSRLGTDGTRIVVADDDGEFTLIEEDGHPVPLLHTRLRPTGVALDEFDPTVPGIEVVAAAADGSVILVRRVAGAWELLVLGDEMERIRALAVGGVDPAVGAEIVVIGPSGDVVVYRRARGG